MQCEFEESCYLNEEYIKPSHKRITKARDVSQWIYQNYWKEGHVFGNCPDKKRSPEE